MGRLAGGPIAEAVGDTFAKLSSGQALRMAARSAFSSTTLHAARCALSLQTPPGRR